MENKKPDNVVYSVAGYNANVLPYATSAGAPVIRVMMWYRGKVEG
jgi:hypothetical protein